MTHKTRRFSELRPSRVDSNLFQYHLKKLISDGYISKIAEGYTLSGRGLYYADRHSSALKAERQQPKIIAIVLIQNSLGEVLLIQKPRQPFLGDYHLPAGKVHEGEDAEQASLRELAEKTNIKVPKLTYHATVHVTIRDADTVISEYYGLVLRGNYEESTPAGVWHHPNDGLVLCPGVPELLSLTKVESGGLYEWDIDVTSVLEPKAE